jgi:hypothetical protein
LRWKDALLQLGGWFGWLRKFTDQLANNKSFAELCQENRDQLNASLSTLPRYFPSPKAVELALPGFNDSLVEPRLLSPAQALDARHRNIENDVIITIRIRLRDFTNKEIGRAMEEFACMLRPSTEKEPTRKGTGRKDSPRSWLDALSAMRLASWYPIYPPDSRAGLQTVRGGLTAVDHSMRSDLVAKSQSMKAIFIHTSVERTRLLKLFSSVNRQRTHNRGPKGKV